MKYELIDDGDLSGLYRVRALKDFGNVKKGERGGQVAGEHNLSQEGDCWIGEDVVVKDNARVEDNATISGFVSVRNTAKVKGNVNVFGKVSINGDAMLKDNVRVYHDVAGGISIQAGCLLRDDVSIEFEEERSVGTIIRIEMSNCELRGGFNIDHSFLERLVAQIPPSFETESLNVLEMYLHYGVYDDSSVLVPLASFAGRRMNNCRIRIREEHEHKSEILKRAHAEEFTNKFNSILE